MLFAWSIVTDKPPDCSTSCAFSGVIFMVDEWVQLLDSSPIFLLQLPP